MHFFKFLKKTVAVFLVFCMLFAYFAVSAVAAGAEALYTGVVFDIDPGSSLTVRAAPDKSSAFLGKLYNDDVVYIYEQVDNWYKIEYKSGFGYVNASFVTNVVPISKPEYQYDEAFEAALSQQGFPESYKVHLRELHAIHPNWIFVADHLPMTFADATIGESAIGLNLVQDVPYGHPDSWKSMGPNAYNWSSNTYISYDSGSWVCAEKGIIDYFMEPRNFLNEQDVFVFLEQSYNPAVQTREGLQKILNGTFMEGAFPESDYATYVDVLMAAASQYGVSPYVLAASILVEQGTWGTGGSISGNEPGYENYYNYFNIRAYADKGYTAVQYGLLYAQEKGWNTHAKSIFGGAESYATGYVKRGQDTLYYKKFNVVSAPYYDHQYMANVQAAYMEADKLAASYSGVDGSAALTFSIPVYKDMPESNTTSLPAYNGPNNYYLTSLAVNGVPVENFDKYNNYYTAPTCVVGNSINITATAPEGATISGAGTVYLNHGMNNIVITVTAASGRVAYYTYSVEARFDGWALINGRWAYYENSEMVKNRWIQDSTGCWCYIGEDGFCYANQWMQGEKDIIYFDADGRLTANCWIYDGTGWFYVDENSYPLRNSWKEDAYGWTYLGADGRMLTNAWIQDSLGWCYLGEAGYTLYNCWVADSVGLCYLDENGYIAKNQWIVDAQGWYYLDADGYRVSNRWIMDALDWVYLDYDGKMLTNGWITDKLGWCYVGADGYCVRDKWVADSDGWLYLDHDGRILKNSWVKDAVDWCYVGVDGYCLTNEWIYDSVGKCYLGSDGRILRNSWLTENKKTYYFDANGHMVTGKVKIGNKYYTFNSKGVWYA